MRAAAAIVSPGADALADGDTIHAVIKGSAINNDGSAKVGYTAPSMEGQAEVILAAQAIAGVDADTISYVETHGTGTTIGDPIEIAFNVRYLLEGLKAMGADQVVLQCNAPTTPAVLVPVDDEAAFTYLVMPVQIRA